MEAVTIQDNNEKPEQMRERLRQGELRNNPTGNLNDAYNRAGNGNLADLVGGFGWKGIAIFVLVIVIGAIIYAIFF